MRLPIFGWLMAAVLPGMLAPAGAEVIPSADAVAVIRVDQCAEAAKPRRSLGFYSGPPQGLYDSPGRYECTVVRRLSGAPPTQISLELYPVDPDPFLGEIRFGAMYVIWLSHDNKGWHKLYRQCLQVAGPADLRPLASKQSMEKKLVHERLAALADPICRAAAIFALADEAAPSIHRKIDRYRNDPDPYVQDAVLRSRACRQDLKAIDVIIERCRLGPLGGHQAWNAASCMTQFHDKRAAPSVARLLLLPDRHLRDCAVDCLMRIATPETVPYLMLRLHETHDSQTDSFDGITYCVALAFRTAHPENELSPQGLGMPPPTNRDLAAKIRQWWADELSGEHLPEGKRKPPAGLMALPSDLAKLNTRLFCPYVAVRKKAVTALAGRADQSSIPALLIALDDPEASVAFDASRVLNRLTGVTPRAANADEFARDRAAGAKPYFDWWAHWLATAWVPAGR